jgi:hypothetical protein
VSFFDEPGPEPEREPAPDYRTPEWLAPPDNVDDRPLPPSESDVVI